VYDPGKIELLSVEGGAALELVLGATTEGGASIELEVSAFFILATRDGLRCIFPSRILFCSTSENEIVIHVDH
jgi:hypothetical protein